MKKATGTGFYGDLSPEQEHVLASFKTELAPLSLNPEHYDDYLYLRFLRARKFDLEKSLLMIRNYLQWRVEFGTDQILSFAFPEVTEMKRFYPHGYHKIDKMGRPIYIECLGQLNLKQLFEVTTEERMLRYYVREYERVLVERFPACSQKAGHKIEQSLTILDLSGISMKLMSKQVYNFIKIASSTAQDYYPEMLGRMFIVNAPTLFSIVWSTVKGFIDEKTRNKISILGSKFHREIVELVDEENLPEFLGGTCKCPLGCLNANAGPWNPRDLLTDETGALIDPAPVKRKEMSLSLGIPEVIPEEMSGEDEESRDLRWEDLKQVTELVREKLTRISHLEPGAKV